MYDRPQSITGTAPRPPIAPRTQYEAVFPVCSVLPSGSDSESGTDSRTGTLEPNTKLQRSGSWSFYDPVTLNEVTYANTESTASVQVNKSDNRSSGESSAYSELNLCYENYILELRKKNETVSKAVVAPRTPPRPTKSTILEFDPLVQKPAHANNDLVLLEQLLESDLYGNITGVDPNYDQWSITSELEGDEYINPPTPPKRFDSLGEEVKTQPQTVEDKSKTNWFTFDKPMAAVETKKSGWMKQLNDVLKKVPESARNIRGLYKDKCLDRPILNYRAIANHKGMLFKISRKSVEDLFGEYTFRWCVLANGILTFYTDNTCDCVKEHFSLESILSVQALEKKLKPEPEMHCFELSISGKTGRSAHLFGCPTPMDCRSWMQKIAEALTNRFPMNVVSNYKRMGWTYLKEGVSGNWTGAWLIVSARQLYYAKDDAPMCTVDLRKARCIQLQESDPDSPKTTDKGPNLLVDSQEGTLYLRMWTTRETKLWCVVIQTEAYRNGRRLDEQQLTKDDVPVIVEKCINFIYAHGSMSEGIYRRSGSSSTISEILGQFHQNAWSVTLTLDNCSEHDVANVLKRFLRSLPESLLTSESNNYLCHIADSFQNTSEKVTLYRAVLEQFPVVTYKTLRRLLGHLYFIQSQSVRNLMPMDNLAAIWGPTIVQHEGQDGEWSPTEANLVVQLISLYRELFPVSADELDRERMMLQVLERLLTSMKKYKQFDKQTDVAVLSGELKFADNKTKTCKFVTFKFEQMKLCYFKDRAANVKIQEWNIEDILWYFAHISTNIGKCMMDEKPQNGSVHSNGESRPSSIYDNLKENCQSDDINGTNHDVADGKQISGDMMVDNEPDRSPTQEFLLKTTVPQNLAAVNFAGRHTPTRNSLRHSRMIVMSRTGTMPRSYLPPVITHHRLATVIVTLQTLLGATICCLAAWLLIWTPNLRRRDNPYWSGLPLLASGTFGLLFLCCCRRDRPGTLKGFIINGTKICSVLLSVTAAAASFIATLEMVKFYPFCVSTFRISPPLGNTSLWGLSSAPLHDVMVAPPPL
ncbi:Rho GTPase activating protein at 15B [Carabus blaptoides fortunei]